MGGKRLSKRYPVFFHLALGIGMMLFIFGCNGIEYRTVLKQSEPEAKPEAKPEYVADFQHLEQVLSYIDQGKFNSALVENAKLESHYDYSTSRSSDHDRVIRISARMNTALLKKIIQEEKKLLLLSQKKQDNDLIIKEMKLEMEKLKGKLQSVTLLLKTVERLDNENKLLRQQIKDFKAIDLEGAKIKADMQK